MPTVAYDWVTTETSFPLNNVTLTGNQTFPAITAINGGTQFLAIWSASSTVISGRIVDLDGNTIGSEFTIYENWISDPTDASVTQLTGGDILVTWNQGGDIIGRVVSSTGTPGALLTITSGSLVDTDSDVAALTDGGFVVSWTRDFGGGDLDVDAQIYNADGTTRGSAIGVDTSIETATTQSQVAGLSNGNFAVVYKLEPKAGGDDEVWYRLYSSTGTPIGSATLIDTSGTIEDDPQVVALYGGAFAVAYTDNGWGTGSTEITLRIYNADGSSRTSYIRANTTTAGDQTNPTIALMSNGYIVVGWSNGTELIYQAYTQEGVAVGSNDVTINQVIEAEIIGLQSGMVANVRESSVTDGSGTSIRASIDQLQRHTIGDATNEYLVGDSLPDTIEAGAGNDVITGGLSSDLLVGGAGADIFRDFWQGFNGDVIADFTLGDTINILGSDINTFEYGITGNTLTFSDGASVTLSSVPLDQIVARQGIGNSVDLVVHDPRNDFNGDGRSDILWRDGSGTLSEWLGQANGSFAWNPVSNYSIPASWTLVATGDFNHDMRDDILWRDGSGTLSEWLGQANGSFAWNANATYGVAVSTILVATGDFNKDGRDDILWRDSAGTLSEWLGQANGSFAWNPVSNYSIPISWTLVGTGDFNADGRDDILWRDTAGTFSQWLGQADGSFAWNPSAIYTVPNSWTFEDTGDFNGDGRHDVLWRDNAGTLSEWLGQADGSFAWNPVANYAVQPSWTLETTGDFNKDGRDDIIWRDGSGTLSEWLGQADGSFAWNPSVLYSTPSSWQIQPDLL